LKTRHAVGELQPRTRDGKPAGDPIPNYYPAAVTEDEWLAARAGAEQRRHVRGHLGKNLNVFAGLLRHAPDRDTLFAVKGGAGRRPGRHGRAHVALMTPRGADGRGQSWSFPYTTFEPAVLSLLAEVDPAEVLGQTEGPDEVLTLSGELAQVEAKIAELEAELLKGDVAALARVLRAQEDRKRDLATRLAQARRKAAHPLSEAWGEAKSLLEALKSAPDPEDARLRLRGALRRIVDSFWLLIVPRGRDRLCAVQVWFQGSGSCRNYLILHRPAFNGGGKNYRPAA